MNKKVIALPFDGFTNVPLLVENCRSFFKSPFASRLVGVLKFNDALHFPHFGPHILHFIAEVAPADVNFFIDLKLPDVTETDKNILRHYIPYKPSIVTVSSVISCKALLVIKETLPDTRIALVDTLTDIGEEECLVRYGVTPLEKITKALESFRKLLKEDNPIELVVCSPRETVKLKERFPYEIINAGIRSPHMAKDHQERTTSAYDALAAGADIIVMGTQLTKGNPAKGISPEKSQELTAQEIDRFFAEQAV